MVFNQKVMSLVIQFFQPCVQIHLVEGIDLHGTHGLSAQRTKSSRLKGSQTPSLFIFLVKNLVVIGEAGMSNCSWKGFYQQPAVRAPSWATELELLPTAAAWESSLTLHLHCTSTKTLALLTDGDQLELLQTARQSSPTWTLQYIATVYDFMMVLTCCTPLAIPRAPERLAMILNPHIAHLGVSQVRVNHRHHPRVPRAMGVARPSLSVLLTPISCHL